MDGALAGYAANLNFTDSGDATESDKLTYEEKLILISANDITKQKTIEQMPALQVHKWAMALARLEQRKADAIEKAKENADRDAADLEQYG